MTEPFQFELDGALSFGADLPIGLAAFDPSGYEIRSQDFDLDGADVRIFGRDWLTPALWSFTLLIEEGSRPAAMSRLGELQAAWDPRARTQPGAVSTLRYRLGDEVRRVYGRPRRFTPVLSDVVFGYVPVVADFQRADVNHYSDAERSISSDMTGSTNPLGISSPVRSPFAAAFGEWSAPSRTAVVGGDRPTWPIVEFQGGTNPWVEVAGWRCRVLASLNWDEVVTVDTRPWVRSSTLRGSYMPLDRGSRLAEMSLPPGSWPVHYGNDSSLGSPSVTVRWRDAFSSL